MEKASVNKFKSKSSAIGLLVILGISSVICMCLWFRCCKKIHFNSLHKQIFELADILIKEELVKFAKAEVAKYPIFKNLKPDLEKNLCITI